MSHHRKKIHVITIMLLLAGVAWSGFAEDEALESEDATAEVVVHPITSKEATFGTYIGLGPAIVGIDFRFGRVYGYASGSLLLPMLFDHLKINLAFGIGPSFKFFSDNWTFDVFATAQADMEGINKLDFNIAVGAGFGWKYIHPQGFTLGFKLPFLGYTIPVLSSVGFWGLVGNAERVAYYYLSFLMSVPVVSIGYTF